MSCVGCSNNDGSGLPRGCRNNGNCASGGCNKLEVFNWLSGMDRMGNYANNHIEVRFKNTRKEFFKNTDNIDLNIGDTVAVEANSGHDIGIVSLVGELVKVQMNKKGQSGTRDIKKVYRKAKQTDVDKWCEAQSLENKTMFKARKVARELKLDMKISDVEYQGDLTKATFYYTADNRVDFRELIRVLADEFKVRIEMRQIGARQEAARVGGIGSCGRELCCSTWLTDFRSVATSAARYQQLSLNPLKLAGQCGKLKCCLNFELDTYLDAIKDFPKNEVKLKTHKGDAFHQKTDIFKRIMWYSYVDEPNIFIALTVDKVKEIAALNKSGKKPQELKNMVNVVEEKIPDYENVVGQDSLTRFDKRKKNKSKRKKKKFKGNNSSKPKNI